MKLLMENWRKFVNEREAPQFKSNDFCSEFPDACAGVLGTVRANMPQIPDGGEFEKGRLDTKDLFGMADETPEIADANTIKITPEMREKVLKEGLQTFASGGVIGNLPSRLAKI